VVALGEDGQVTLPACALVTRPDGVIDPDLALGVDVLGWGSLEDATADVANEPATHWQTNGDATERFDVERGAYLRLGSTSVARADARQVHVLLVEKLPPAPPPQDEDNP